LDLLGCYFRQKISYFLPGEGKKHKYDDGYPEVGESIQQKNDSPSILSKVEPFFVFSILCLKFPAVVPWRGAK